MCMYTCRWCECTLEPLGGYWGCWVNVSFVPACCSQLQQTWLESCDWQVTPSAHGQSSGLSPRYNHGTIWTPRRHRYCVCVCVWVHAIDTELLHSNLISCVTGSCLVFFLLFILSKEKRPSVIPSAQATVMHVCRSQGSQYTLSLWCAGHRTVCTYIHVIVASDAWDA